MNAPPYGTAVFLAILPTIERHARFVFRGQKDFHRREDCVQETLALCWLWSCRLWEQGKDARAFPTTLALYATRQVKCGRSFVGKKTYRNDALSPLAQWVHGFRTETLPGKDSPAAFPWQAALRDNVQSSPPDQAAFRIDFPDFLAGLSDRDRQITEDMMMGDTTQELSGRYRLSAGRISQLRRELKDDWHAFAEEAA
jgi:DNA-directed RNA polymerase specialized sigma24 family protein